MIKRGTKNCVLVELEKISEDEYNLSSGVKLFTNTAFAAQQKGKLQLDINPEIQRIYGTCVAVPDVLTKGDLVKFDNDEVKFADSIAPEVQVGDRVYFNYVSVHKGSLLEYEGKTYCNINYSAILCVVRHGTCYNTVSGHGSVSVIIPIGGNIMCEEYYGEKASAIDLNGQRYEGLEKVYGTTSKSGLVTGLITKPSQKQATVKITGSALIGDDIEVSPGDLITFPNKFGFPNNIEGTNYLFVKYWDILAIVQK